MENNVIIKTPEQQREELLAKISDFKLMDDTYMSAFFNGRRDLIEFILRIIMGDDKLIVKNDKTQKVLKNLQGRSVTLDVDAVLSDGKEIDVEVQQENKGAKPKRARFHSSIMDSNCLLPGQDFEMLPETYVIFITSNDYYGMGLPLYTIDRYIKELNMKPFDDKEHIIYVNGENQADTPLGKLMHDFKCQKPEDMYYKNLAERADQLKNTEGGREEMCKIMEDLNNESVRQEKYQTAIRLIKMNLLSAEDIAKATDLSVEDINTLIAMVRETA